MTQIQIIPASEPIRALMTGLFDYAGLFPPASLCMADAVRQYTRHLQGSDRWMTGPFVCTVDRLSELIEEAEIHRDVGPFDISILPHPPREGTSSLESSYAKSFSEDMDRVYVLFKGANGLIRPTMIEARAPSRSLTSVDEMISCLCQMKSLPFLTEMGVKKIFIEVARSGAFVYDLETTCAAMEILNVGTVSFSLKIRCGGMKESDYPSVRDIAIFLSTILPAGCSFKATAGLHHPVRHFNKAAGTTMHGFLNVFFAAIVCSQFHAGASELVTILEDEDPAHFEFVDGGLRYGEWTVSQSDLERIRSDYALSIGSCSIDEPVHDLLNLGLFIDKQG